MPFPQRAVRALYGRDLPADSVLTIEQLFALMEVMPEDLELRNATDVAVQPLLAWARDNPELTTRYPAPFALAENVQCARQQ